MPARPLLRLLFALAALLALTRCAPAPSAGGRSPVVRDGYTVTRDITYTPPHWPAPIRGDLYRPRPARASMPAVLLVHGGGWTGSDGRWQMEPIARQLVKRGLVVLNVTYRLAPRWTYPAPVDDLHQALRWMRSHSSVTGIDPHNISVFGYSAGGYLAALVGLDPAQDVRAIVAGGAPSNLLLYPGGDLVPQFLGGRQEQIPEKFRSASPVNHVTRRSPPVFLYHGTRDHLVPPEHALQFSAALTRQGIPHHLHWVHGRDHIEAFLLPDRSVRLAIDFLTTASRPAAR